MRFVKLLLGCGIVLLVACSSRNELSTTAGGPILFEGVRLIDGNGGAPVEDSAFVMENNKITMVGKRGQIQAPAGAVRMDLTGKTVMPALIDTHTHLGWA